MFDVELSNQADKFLRKCPEELHGRITEKIEELRNEPFPSGSIALQGSDKIYRIRVGDYRLVYAIHPEHNLLRIFDIDKRSRVYQ